MRARPKIARARLNQTPQPEQLIGPKIGEPWRELKLEDVHWPDTNTASIQYSSYRDEARTSRMFGIRVRLKTQTVMILLLVFIATYAVVRHDSGLIRDVGNHWRSQKPRG